VKQILALKEIQQRYCHGDKSILAWDFEHVYKNIQTREFGTLFYNIQFKMYKTVILLVLY